MSCYFHFRDEKNESQKDQTSCPKLHSYEAVEPGFLFSLFLTCKSSSLQNSCSSTTSPYEEGLMQSLCSQYIPVVLLSVMIPNSYNLGFDHLNGNTKDVKSQVSVNSLEIYLQLSFT